MALDTRDIQFDKEARKKMREEAARKRVEAGAKRKRESLVKVSSENLDAFLVMEGNNNVEQPQPHMLPDNLKDEPLHS